MKNFIPIKLTLLLSMLILNSFAFSQCLTAIYGQYPSNSYNPSCGLSCTYGTIVTDGWAGEYSNVTVTAGNTYRFRSSISSDIVTISNSTGSLVYGSGTSGVNGFQWTSTISGTVRFYTHTSGCGNSTVNRVKSVCCQGVSPVTNPCNNSTNLSCGASANFNLSSGSGSWNNLGGPYSTPGKEQIFVFTASITGSHTVNVTNNQYFVDLYFRTGICASTGWTYVDDIASSASNNLNLTAGTTYYFLLDDEDVTASAGTISITCPTPAPNPCNSITTINACGSNNGFNISAGAGSWNQFGGPFNTPGREVIYRFTPTVTASYPITITNSNSGWIDLFYKVQAGPCSSAGWTYVDDITGTATNNITLTAGVTYQFLLDDEDLNGSSGSIQIACPCISPSNGIDFSFNAPFSHSSTTLGACDDCSLRTGEDRTYQININCPGSYTFSLCGGATWDSYIYLTTAACSGNIIASNDDACTNSFQSVITVNNLAVGTYYLTLEGFNSAAAGAYTISVNGTGAAPTISTGATMVSCNGAADGSISANISGDAPVTAVTFNGNPGYGPWTGLSSGSYVISATNCWGTSTQTVVITEPAPLSGSSSAGNILCAGGTTTVTVSANGGTPPYSGVGTFVVSSGNHTYTVTDANGCSAQTTITVTEPDALLATSNSAAILCNGGTTTATVAATGGTAPYAGVGNFVVSSGNYTYVVTDANGCSTQTTITVTEPDALLATSNSAGILCNGGTTTATVAATGGTAPYTGVGNFVVSSGNYTYTVTDANGCSTQTVLQVTQPPALNITASSPVYNCGYNISCFGLSDGQILATASGGTPIPSTGGYVYQWSHGPTSSAVTGLSVGTYSVTVTDNNGCTASTTASLSQPDMLDVTLTPSIYNCGYNISCDAAADGSAAAVVTGGCAPYVYNWSNGSTGANATGLSATTYSVSIVDANGCSASGNVALTAPSPLTIDGGNDVTVYFGYGPASCATLSPTLIAGGCAPYHVTWNGGTQVGNSTTVCPQNTTTYTVTVVDANGCSAADEVTVCVVNVACVGGGRNINTNISAAVKVLVCHVPPGNAANTIQLCIDPADVASHLAHGDFLGSCSGSPTSCGNPVLRSGEIVQEQHAAHPIELSSYPNPFDQTTTVQIEGVQSDHVDVAIYSTTGQLISTVYAGPMNEDSIYKFDITTEAPAGIYIVSVRTHQGQQETLRIVKTN